MLTTPLPAPAPAPVQMPTQELHPLLQAMVRARLLPLLLAAALCGGCSTSIGARIYAGYMEAEFDGDVALAPNVATPIGPINQVDGQLGIDDPAGSPYGRIELQLGPANVTVSGFTYDQDGQGTLSATFGGLNAGTNVESTIEMVNARASLHFSLLDLGVFRLSPGVSVDYFDVDMTVRDTANLGLFERVEVEAPVPMLFAQAEVDLGIVAATLDIGGIKVDLPDADGTYFDIEALARFTPFTHFEVFAGYRYIRLDADGTADGQPFVAELDMRGWMIGGGIKF